MKLLYIANVRLPTEKAHGIAIMKMCEAFADLGHEVELVVPTRETPITEDPFVYYAVKPRFMLTRLPVPDTVSWGWVGFWAQALLFSIAAARYARRSNADVVYSRDPALFFFGRMPKSATLVWEVHTKPPPRVIKKIKDFPIRIITITNGLRTVFLESGVPVDRVIVAHDAVDTNSFSSAPEKAQARAELALPSNEKIVAYIGKYKTMSESKGVEDIIIAVGEARVGDPSISLLLVGLNDDEFSEVRVLTERAGLGHNAYLVGHVSRADIPRYLRSADILVMNYPNTEHYAHYMSPLKLFEYMASGVPIVSSDLPSIREVLSDSDALFFASDKTEALSSALVQIFADPESAKKRAASAELKVREFSWGNRARQILASLPPI